MLKQKVKSIIFDSKFDGYAKTGVLRSTINRMASITIGIPFRINSEFIFWKKFGRKKSAIQESSQRNPLTVVTVVKNEGRYIREWLAYHYLLGIKNFLIYDNESTDNTHDEITDTMNKLSLNVTYVYWPGKSQQKEVYRDSIVRLRDSSAWALVIDADEFLYVDPKTDLWGFLNGFSKDTAQVLIGWQIFGSSGHRKRPDGLVIDNYRYHATDKYITDYKALIRPDRIADSYSPHYFSAAGKTVNVKNKRLWFYPFAPMYGSEPAPMHPIHINHYYDKSLEDLHDKIQRGDGFNANKATRNARNFKMQDRNDIQENDLADLRSNLHELLARISK